VPLVKKPAIIMIVGFCRSVRQVIKSKLAAHLPHNDIFLRKEAGRPDGFPALAYSLSLPRSRSFMPSSMPHLMIISTTTNEKIREMV